VTLLDEGTELVAHCVAMRGRAEDEEGLEEVVGEAAAEGEGETPAPAGETPAPETSS
jgi:hypothetical protein